MWYTFWLDILNFALHIFVTLVCLATAWIYIDSYSLKHEGKTALRAAGFLVVAAWAALVASQSANAGVVLAITVCKFAGLFAILVSFAIDPVPTPPGGRVPRQSKRKPKPTTQKNGLAASSAPRAFGALWFTALPWLQPAVISSALLLGITALVFVRCTRGFIKNWRSLFLAFLLFTASELLTILYGWKDSSIVLTSRFLADYGPVWYLVFALTLAAFVVLARWTWGHIRFRMVPELFITFVASVFLIFTLTTGVFTVLLLRSVERDQLTQLATSARTVQYAIDQLKNEAVLVAKIGAENPAIRTALAADDTDTLYTVGNGLLFEHKADFLDIINAGADVVMRAENRAQVGETLAADPVVVQAFDGRSVASVARIDGLTAPTMTIRAASPILSDGGKVLGAVVTGYTIDNAFVDGVKSVTGLDVTVFGDRQRSATTLFTAGTTRRDIGVLETDTRVHDRVLGRQELFTGTVKVFDAPFYAAYVPLTDIDNTTVGMFFIGRPQSELLTATQDTIHNAFLVAIILMLLSTLPAYGIAHYIALRQKI